MIQKDIIEPLGIVNGLVCPEFYYCGKDFNGKHIYHLLEINPRMTMEYCWWTSSIQKDLTGDNTNPLVWYVRK